MWINEIAVGASVTVITGAGAQKVEFETKVVPLEKKAAAKIGIREPFVAVEMMHMDGQSIGFSYGNTPCRMITMLDNMPYLWKDVSIYLVMNPGTSDKIHVITCKQEGKKYNRRASFRQWVGTEGEAQLDGSQMKVNVTMRDISSGGVGFVMRKLDGHPEKGQFVHIIFSDPAFDARFSLVAQIIWVKETEDGRFIVGAKLKTTSQAIGRYTTQKQRSAMKTGGPAQPVKKVDEKSADGSVENPDKATEEKPAEDGAQSSEADAPEGQEKQEQPERKKKVF